MERNSNYGDYLPQAQLASAMFHKISAQANQHNRTILKDYLQKQTDVLNAAHRKLEKASSNGELIKPCSNSIRLCAEQIRSLSEGLNQPFTLFVMGMGKFGKSTLVNALLGQEVAEVDALPKTWKIDIFEAASDSLVTICKSDGSKTKAGIDDARKILANEEARREASESKIEARFQRDQPAIKTIEQKEDFRKLLLKELLYRSPIVEVHWPCHPTPLLKKFRVVDTPGLWQEMMNGEAILDDLREFYHKADGILWIINANMISSQKQRDLLDDLEKALSIIGGRHNNMIGVLNRIDQVHKNGGDDAVNRVIQEAQRIFGDFFSDIIPISALEAVNANRTDNRALLIKSGMPHLFDTIDRVFYKGAARIQYESKLSGYLGFSSEMIRTTDEYLKRLSSDEEIRRNLKKELAENLPQFQDSLLQSLNQNLESHSKTVKRSIENYAEKLFDFPDANAPECISFLSQQIFHQEELTAAINDFQNKIAAKITSTMRYYCDKAYFREFKHLDASHTQLALSLRPSQDIVVDSSATNVSFGKLVTGVAAAFLIGGPLGVILALIAEGTGLLKWLAVQFKLPGLKRQLHSQLDKMIEDIKGSATEYIVNSCRQIASSAESTRENSFTALHGPATHVPTITAICEEAKLVTRSPIQWITSKQIIKQIIKGA